MLAAQKMMYARLDQGWRIALMGDVIKAGNGTERLQHLAYNLDKN